jgi:Secretion system C-terminal sorting domain
MYSNGTCKCGVLVIGLLLFFNIAMAQVQGQLPVNLKIFKARSENNTRVKVFWTTEYEKDNAYFDIERSVNGIHFSATGRVPGVNYYGILTDYFFYDVHPLNGISYYRLKQVDVDGAFNYSPIVKVSIADKDNSFDIFPNPAAGRHFRVDLLKAVPGTIDLAIFDASGKLRFRQQYSTGAAIIVVHWLTPGMYTVSISGKDFKAAKKLLLQ